MNRRNGSLRFSLCIVWVAAFLCAAVGCNRRSEVVYDAFIRADANGGGVYMFNIPLTDSLAVYDFYLYGRTFRYKAESIPLKIRWISPSGESFVETVYMNNLDSKGRKELYRSGVVPSDRGEWRISIRPEGDDAALLTGLGLICSESNGHGAR